MTTAFLIIAVVAVLILANIAGSLNRLAEHLAVIAWWDEYEATRLERELELLDRQTREQRHA
jgi:hypothetical protein